MSELDLIRHYNDRQDAEFRQWLAEPAPPPASADNPRAVAGNAQLGPPEPEPPGVWAKLYNVLASGPATAKDSAVSGIRNVAGGILDMSAAGDLENADKPVSTFGRGAGQAAFGLLELASALPAGAAMLVQRAAQELPYVGNKLDTVVPGLAGSEPGVPSTAGFLRTVLMTPQLFLDPKMRGVDATALAAAVNEPMTYGELLNIAAMFAAGPAVAKAPARMKANVIASRTPKIEVVLRAAADMAQREEIRTARQRAVAFGERGALPELTPAEAIGRFTQIAPDAELAALSKAKPCR